MDVWSLVGPLDGVSGEILSEVMAGGAGLWKSLAESLLNYSEVANIKKRRETTEEVEGWSGAQITGGLLFNPP
ncbi:uncharacterized [Tachysurus ichikawai]